MIYFDNNATTPPAAEVIAEMQQYLGEEFGNPSSAYSIARGPRTAIAEARDRVARLLGADPDEIAFTSGGTESDNWAIRGALASRPESRHIVTTRVEHEAVRYMCEKLNADDCEITWLDVDGSGMIDLEQLRQSLRKDTAVVSVMLANNETGVIFPVSEAAAIVRENSNALFHTDAVNAAGKTDVDVSSTAIDLLSISAHKFYGPKGVGALFIRKGIRFAPQSIGGGQEAGRRAGTEAVHQIVGIGKAAEMASDLAPMEDVRLLRNRLESGIADRIPDIVINGQGSPRLPNTSNISFASANGEAILASLNDEGIFVSTGSACNEGGHSVSPVLKAMEVPFALATGSIRFSLGRGNTANEVDRVLEILPGIIERLRRISTGK